MTRPRVEPMTEQGRLDRAISLVFEAIDALHSAALNDENGLELVDAVSIVTAHSAHCPPRADLRGRGACGSKIGAMPAPDSERRPLRVTAVSGRHARGGRRGLPKVNHISFADQGGQEVAGSVVSEGTGAGRASFLYAIPPNSYETCPICLDATADSAEHVPPRAFGGAPATTTCQACNNTFGSRTEASMQDWFDQALQVRLYTKGVRAPVGQGRTLLLRNADGPNLLLPDGKSDPLVGALEHLQNHDRDDLEMEVRTWSPSEVRVGMLKSAFLAASLALGGVPDVPSAHEIRGELAAVRSTRRRRDLVAGPRARALRFHRCRPETEAGPPLAVYATEGEPSRYLISLGPAILVDWPFPEISPQYGVAIRVATRFAREASALGLPRRDGPTIGRGARALSNYGRSKTIRLRRSVPS